MYYVGTDQLSWLSLNGGRTLPHRLANFLLTYRLFPHATTGVTPCSLFLKHQIRTRFDLLKPDQESHVTEKQSQQKVDHDQRARSRQFQAGQSAMARNLHPGPKWVPGVIVQSPGPLSYLIKTSKGQTWRWHVDHLIKKLHTELKLHGKNCGVMFTPTWSDYHSYMLSLHRSDCH